MIESRKGRKVWVQRQPASHQRYRRCPGKLTGRPDGKGTPGTKKLCCIAGYVAGSTQTTGYYCFFFSFEDVRERHFPPLPASPEKLKKDDMPFAFVSTDSSVNVGQGISLSQRKGIV
jgi:hypothetical protein